MNKDRFLNVLRWQLMLSKQQLVTFALAFFAIIAVPQALGLLISRDANTQVETTSIALLALSAYIIMAGTRMFVHIKTRQQRIHDFMLPATTKEKFVARYLVIAVALPLVAVVGFLAGDLVQYLLTLVFGSAGTASAVSYAMETVSGLDRIGFGTMSATVSVGLSLVSLHAFFLLLGSIFHKHPMILSWSVLMLLNFLVLTVGTGVVYGLSLLQNQGYVVIVYDTWLKVALSLLSIAFTVFCYRFAYRRYTRLQVIDNKWLNI